MKRSVTLAVVCIMLMLSIAVVFAGCFSTRQTFAEATLDISGDYREITLDELLLIVKDINLTMPQNYIVNTRTKMNSLEATLNGLLSLTDDGYIFGAVSKDNGDYSGLDDSELGDFTEGWEIVSLELTTYEVGNYVYASSSRGKVKCEKSLMVGNMKAYVAMLPDSDLTKYFSERTDISKIEVAEDKDRLIIKTTELIGFELFFVIENEVLSGVVQKSEASALDMNIENRIDLVGTDQKLVLPNNLSSYPLGDAGDYNYIGGLGVKE